MVDIGEASSRETNEIRDWVFFTEFSSRPGRSFRHWLILVGWVVDFHRPIDNAERAELRLQHRRWRIRRQVRPRGGYAWQFRRRNRCNWRNFDRRHVGGSLPLSIVHGLSHCTSSRARRRSARVWGTAVRKPCCLARVAPHAVPIAAATNNGRASCCASCLRASRAHMDCAAVHRRGR